MFKMSLYYQLEELKRQVKNFLANQIENENVGKVIRIKSITKFLSGDERNVETETIITPKKQKCNHCLASSLVCSSEPPRTADIFKETMEIEADDDEYGFKFKSRAIEEYNNPKYLHKKQRETTPNNEDTFKEALEANLRDIEEYEALLAQLQNKLESMNSQLAIKEQQRKAIAFKPNSTIPEEASALQQRIKDFQEKLNADVQFIQQMLKQVLEYRSEYEGFSKEIETLKQQLMEVMVDPYQKSEELDKALNERKQLKDKKRKLSISFEEVKEQDQQKLQEMNQEIQLYAERIHGECPLGQVQNKIKKAIAELINKCECKKPCLEQLVISVQKHGDMLEAHEKTLNSEDNTIETLKLEIDRVKQNMLNLYQEYDQYKNALEAGP